MDFEQNISWALSNQCNSVAHLFFVVDNKTAHRGGMNQFAFSYRVTLHV